MLASDPVLPAYEAFEAVRLEYVALQDDIHAVHHAVEAGMSPEPPLKAVDAVIAQNRAAALRKGLGVPS